MTWSRLNPTSPWSDFFSGPPTANDNGHTGRTLNLAKTPGVVTVGLEELTGSSHSVIIHTMNVSKEMAPISDLLRRTIAESGVSYNALQKETGVTRASIMRFVRGDQSLRLDVADRLAAFFDLELRKKG